MAVTEPTSNAAVVLCLRAGDELVAARLQCTRARPVRGVNYWPYRYRILGPGGRTGFPPAPARFLSGAGRWGGEYVPRAVGDVGFGSGGVGGPGCRHRVVRRSRALESRWPLGAGDPAESARKGPQGREAGAGTRLADLLDVLVHLTSVGPAPHGRRTVEAAGRDEIPLPPARAMHARGGTAILGRTRHRRHFAGERDRAFGWEPARG